MPYKSGFHRSINTFASSLQNYSLSNVEVGPVFECVRFSIHGRSPLLQHYLYQHHLSESKAPQGGLGMSRTQVKEIPSRGVTYKQLLKKQEKHSERLYDEYQRYVFFCYIHSGISKTDLEQGQSGTRHYVFYTTCRCPYLEVRIVS